LTAWGLVGKASNAPADEVLKMKKSDKDKITKQALKTIEIAYKIRGVEFGMLPKFIQQASIDIYQGAIRDYNKIRREIEGNEMYQEWLDNQK